MKSRKYILHYFDNLVHRLDCDSEDMAPDQQARIAERTRREQLNFQIAIKEAVCSSSREIELQRFLSRHYLEALHLQEILIARIHKDPSWYNGQSLLLDTLTDVLAGLGKYLEQRYGYLLRFPDPLPDSNLKARVAKISAEFQSVSSLLPSGLFSELLSKHFVRLAVRVRSRFVFSKSSLDYMNALVRRIHEWDWDNSHKAFDAIERFFVYMNFNSKAVMDLMISKMESQLSLLEKSEDKLLYLMDRLRSFRQLHRKPRICLNPGYWSLDQFIEKWFEAEIAFLRSTTALAGHGVPHPSIKAPLAQQVSLPKQKIRCGLSGDQIAIVLRAADEVRMIESRSLNMVFKTMIPYIATDNRSTLSPSSIRVKSYHPEHRDKSFVIDKLHQMIEKIKDY